jgi:trehalose/maltose hydrolase-like predicted phosphorylase
VLWLDPRIPKELSRLRMTLRYRRHWGLEIEISGDAVRVSARPADIYPIRIGIRGEIVELRAGASVERPL